MPHKSKCDPNLGGAKEYRREVYHKRLRQPAMVAPNLLQPRAEIDDDAESGEQSCPDYIAADHRHWKE